MEKEIKGTIEYTLKITEEHTDIEFNSTYDNDVATLIICQVLMESAATGLKMQRERNKGIQRKVAEDQLRSILAGRQGLRTLVGVFLENYNDMKAEEDKPKITVENGFLTEEEILKLPNGEQMLANLKAGKETELKIVKEPSTDEIN